MAEAEAEAAPHGSNVGLRLTREQRDHVRSEVIRRTVEDHKEMVRKSKDLNLEVIINDAVYQEQERLRSAKPGKEDREQRRFWNQVEHEFHRVSEAERERILERIAGMYVDEIMGYFNPVIHKAAAKILPWGLKAMLSRFSPAGWLKYLGTRLNLEENLVISGPLDRIRELAGRATLIMTPTHVSNLDSVVIGLGLYQKRLPPFTYGAGLNLFSNPIISFFMNNLGAYKVDRRKKNGIYKTALKHYATLSMEMGQHNLFFPGGTRSRSGEVEQKLKLGLLGCGVNVYVSNLRAGKPNPDLFIIPCTLSCGLVLEARSLIEDYLQETGKSRYIRVRSDFSRPMRVLKFWRNLQSMNSRIHMHFGEPLDLFGNRVDKDGISRDSHGRPVDRGKYVERDGRPAHNPQRDQEYTRELGRSILAAFRRDNVAMSTHAAAFATFNAMRRRNPQYDLYRALRTSGPDHAVPAAHVHAELASLLARLRDMEARGEILLADDVRTGSATEVFAKAMVHFGSFHDGEVLLRGADGIYTENMKLLYYYRNRLDHYGLDERPDADPVPSAADGKA
ncbi:MAG TPA: 1-acyl-sn-glycerol-3-phosphate acyltransferase [Fibrobacteria bacterium]|nr:1-acyl-sn-glycerol-3-phosphate acyltransferase [Fibrobacteria bacterium]